MGGMRRHRRSQRQAASFAIVTAVVFLLFASSSAFSLFPTRKLGEPTQCPERALPGGGVREEGGGGRRPSGWKFWGRVLMTQPRLSVPGSSPPTCRSKCGRCSPCKAVHVPIQPGFSMPLEYYPEAWRCKCGNKLFMP